MIPQPHVPRCTAVVRPHPKAQERRCKKAGREREDGKLLCAQHAKAERTRVFELYR